MVTYLQEDSMNRERAMDKGYRFIGYCSRDKEEMKAKAKEIRSEGRAAFVMRKTATNRIGESWYSYSVWAKG